MVGVLSVFFGGTFLVLLMVGVVLGFTLESKAIVIGYFAVLAAAGLLSVLLELYCIFMVVLAWIKAHQGEWFRYPFCIRVIRPLFVSDPPGSRKTRFRYSNAALRLLPAAWSL